MTTNPGNGERPPPTLAEQMAESAAEDDAARIASEPATADCCEAPCPYCWRQRAFVRRDGQIACEKCERVWPAAFLPFASEPVAIQPALTDEEWGGRPALGVNPHASIF